MPEHKSYAEQRIETLEYHLSVADQKLADAQKLADYRKEQNELLSQRVAELEALVNQQDADLRRIRRDIDPLLRSLSEVVYGK